MKPLHSRLKVGGPTKSSAALLVMRRSLLSVLSVFCVRALVVFGKALEQAIVVFLGIAMGLALTIWVFLSSIDVWFPLTVKALWTFAAALVRITRLLLN